MWMSGFLLKFNSNFFLFGSINELVEYFRWQGVELAD